MFLGYGTKRLLLKELDRLRGDGVLMIELKDLAITRHRVILPFSSNT
jgi:hypothetical protein